jgi:hypothetical protein
MTQIDFAIATAVLLIVISLSLFYVSNIVSKNTEETNYRELQKSSLGLGVQLFETENYTNSLGLEEKTNSIQMQSKETGGRSHEETINIDIQPPGIEKFRVYDNLFNEIPAIIQYLPDRVKVIFDVDFAPYEIKQFNMIYFGGGTIGITAEQNIDVQNRIISEKEIKVISQDNCNYINSLDYNYVKGMLGFRNEFRFDLIDCNFGINPPTTASIFSDLYPVFIEKSSGIITSEFANLRVW